MLTCIVEVGRGEVVDGSGGWGGGAVDTPVLIYEARGWYL
jgi:hypothetical protein